SSKAGELRATVEGFPRIAALKAVAHARCPAVGEDVRAPLRRLSDGERTNLLAAVADAYERSSIA
ncbi:MAG TPA: hypothetical protein VH538_05965, partial [Gaiellaceae bacterium]